MTESGSSRRRARMCSRQLREGGIRDQWVLRAFDAVPREAFIESRFWRRFAYAPLPLPIGHGQTLSQPVIVARMLELAEIAPEHTVLDVGAGSGYQTALLAQLCHHVHGVEIVPALAQRANARLRALGIENATVQVADGARGLREHGPYGAILVAAAAQSVPNELTQQLAEGGRLVLPVGPHLSKRRRAWRMLLRAPAAQHLHRITRRSTGLDREVLEGVSFVPFVGA